MAGKKENARARDVKSNVYLHCVSILTRTHCPVSALSMGGIVITVIHHVHNILTLLKLKIQKMPYVAIGNLKEDSPQLKLLQLMSLLTVELLKCFFLSKTKFIGTSVILLGSCR